MGVESGGCAGAPGGGPDGGPGAAVVEAIDVNDAAVERGDAANGIAGTAPNML